MSHFSVNADEGLDQIIPLLQSQCHSFFGGIPTNFTRSFKVMPKVNQYLSFVFLDHHSKIFISATLPQIPHATTLTAHVGWLTSLLRRSHFIPTLSTNESTAMPTSSIRRRRGPIFRSRGIPMTHHYAREFQWANVWSTSTWLVLSPLPWVLPSSCLHRPRLHTDQSSYGAWKKISIPFDIVVVWN